MQHELIEKNTCCMDCVAFGAAGRFEDRIADLEARLATAEAVVEAAKAALHKTANANGKVYAVECAAWDALHDALRPFLPAPDPGEVF